MPVQIAHRVTEQGSGTSVHTKFGSDDTKIAGLVNSGDVGTVPAGVTAVEWGDDGQHTTILTISSTLPNIAGGAALGVGKLLYTFPTLVAVVIPHSSFNMTLDEADGNITADTPEVGIGTVIASGAVSVLSGTATFENVITGQVAADCNGTATTVDLGATAGSPLRVASGGSLFFNVADTWAASGEAACPITGEFAFQWYQAA